MVKTVTTDATHIDAQRYYGGNLANPWQGKAVKRGRLVMGIGGVAVLDDGTFMAFLDLAESAKKPMVFRHVWRFLKELEKKGIGPVFAASDISVPRAEEFLKRLGFVATKSLSAKGERIWVWHPPLS